MKQDADSTHQNFSDNSPHAFNSFGSATLSDLNVVCTHQTVRVFLELLLASSPGAPSARSGRRRGGRGLLPAGAGAALAAGPAERVVAALRLGGRAAGGEVRGRRAGRVGSLPLDAAVFEVTAAHALAATHTLLQPLRPLHHLNKPDRKI